MVSHELSARGRTVTFGTIRPLPTKIWTAGMGGTRPSNSNVLPRGEVGKIGARGSQVMRGYRNRPGAAAGCIPLDDDGVLFIRGPRKEMVIVSGFNVYPHEVADVLHRHPDEHEAVVWDAQTRGAASAGCVRGAADGEVDVSAVGRRFGKSPLHRESGPQRIGRRWYLPQEYSSLRWWYAYC